MAAQVFRAHRAAGRGCAQERPGKGLSDAHLSLPRKDHSSATGRLILQLTKETRRLARYERRISNGLPLIVVYLKPLYLKYSSPAAGVQALCDSCKDLSIVYIIPDHDPTSNKIAK